MNAAQVVDQLIEDVDDDEELSASISAHSRMRPGSAEINGAFERLGFAHFNGTSTDPDDEVDDPDIWVLEHGRWYIRAVVYVNGWTAWMVTERCADGNYHSITRHEFSNAEKVNAYTEKLKGYLDTLPVGSARRGTLTIPWP